MSRELSFRLLRQAALAVVHGDHGAMRARTALLSLAAGVLEGSLSYQEMSRVTVALYDRTLFQKSYPVELFPWEETWFKRRLPPPPARLFLGAAGGGRDLGWLLRRGYEVDALEPAPEAAHACVDLLAGRGRCFVYSYEELAHRVLDGRAAPGSEVPSASYEAVILGWGSLGHVLDPLEWSRLLRACGRLAPAGPVLASFPVQSSRSSPGRARRLGRVLGRLRRPVEGAEPSLEQLVLDFQWGFFRVAVREELESLARSVDRELYWEPEPGYPHVTLVPVSASSAGDTSNR